ncbi:hypothetical protein IRY61_02620 [Candidatus Saccharibacteria bacterium]|nr:hypothetical protein [Candidatus Saccharibacteria bacterium]
MGRHEQPNEPKSSLERKFPFSYTDIAEALGAIGLSGIVVTEVIDSGPANLAFFTAAGLLLYDIARRHDAGKQ